MDTRTTVISLRQDHPDWTLKRLATAAGITRQRVSQVLKAAGLPTVAQRTTAIDPGYRVGRIAKRRDPAVTWMSSAAGALRPGDVGTITELLVCSDLVRRGYHVYRAVNHSSPADLVVWANDRALRVEVKAAGRIGDRWRANTTQTGKYDVLALVDPSGAIRYRPPVDSLFRP